MEAAAIASDVPAPVTRVRPPLYAGPATPEACRAAAEAVAAAKLAGKTLKSVAEALGCTRGTLYRMTQAHGAMRTHVVTLWREDMRELPVCTVITPKGAVTAAVVAYREFPGTLKNLELPGWKLRVDGRPFGLADIRKEAAGSGRAA